jgi:primary-amine oxidase
MLFHSLASLVWCSGILASSLPPLGYERRVLRELFDKRSYNTTTPSAPSCLAEAAPTTSAPKVNIWAPLTPEENLAVWDLLHNPESGLNLTHPDEALLTDNYV